VTLAVIIIVAVLLVLGVGYLIYVLMRKSQTVVPQVTDEDAASRDHVVEIDDQGREIMASQEEPEATRDTARFEDLLKDEIHDLGRAQPTADDES
jgi:cytochrome c-type biogenesis protein CcmH/NrfG